MKKTVKTSDAVSIYNILKSLKIGKLPKEEQFKIIRNARAFKGTAKAFDDYLADVRESLKPENYDELVQTYQNGENVPKERKQEIEAALLKYQKDVEECLQTELEKEVEIDGIEALAQDSLATLAEVNDLDVEKYMLLEDM